MTVPGEGIAGLESFWLEQHQGLVSYTAWLMTLLERGDHQVACTKCGAMQELFSVTAQGEVHCTACRQVPEAELRTVESLSSAFTENLVLLRNYHLFLLGLYVLREEVAVEDGQAGEKMLDIIVGKQTSLLEARQIWILVNRLAAAAKARGLDLPLDSPEIQPDRIREALRLIGEDGHGVRPPSKW